MEIIIRNITKTFGSLKALSILELHMYAGEIVGVVGNNGAGKTTLFRILLDILKPDSGFVMLDGQKVNRSEEWKK